MSQPMTTTGDEIEELWRAYAGDLFRFAALLVGPSDAEDVATDAFLGACRAAVGPTVREPRSYLLGAVAKRALSFRRSRQRRWRRDLAAVGPAVTSPADEFAGVRAAVARLTTVQRSVVYFAYWEDLAQREIAELLGVSPGTVHRNLSRAKARLRKDL